MSPLDDDAGNATFDKVTIEVHDEADLAWRPLL